MVAVLLGPAANVILSQCDTYNQTRCTRTHGGPLETANSRGSDKGYT